MIVTKRKLRQRAEALEREAYEVERAGIVRTPTIEYVSGGAERRSAMLRSQARLLREL